jgi:hypothetical protein
MVPFADKINRFVEKDAGLWILDAGCWLLVVGYSQGFFLDNCYCLLLLPTASLPTALLLTAYSLLTNDL